MLPRSRPFLSDRVGFSRLTEAYPRLGGVAFLVLVLGACILREPKVTPNAQSARRPLPVATRFARLTHAQWANTVRDLFGTHVIQDESLRPDPTPNGFLFDNYAASQNVDDALWRDYQRFAAKVAEDVTRTPSVLAQILPPRHDGTAARARDFITSVGARVHRRPLSAEQIRQYLDVFEAGRSAYPGMPELDSGVRLVLEAMLQSPHFLYRAEGSGGSEGGRFELDGHELATRLSYTLWNTMPDAELFERARTGELDDTALLGDVAARMLGDPRSEALVVGFHAQLFDRERLERAAPSPERFPELSERFVAHAGHESDLFVKHHVLEQNAGYGALLNSTESFVNAELAKVYGLDGTFDERFTKVSFDPTLRRGLLTRAAFLASHATSVDPDPIHRGVFVARRLLYLPLTAPGDLPPLPPANGRTNRQTVEAHTQAPGSGCSVCHERTINPLGFPFEVYDAIGRVRTMDNGVPVNPETLATLDGEKVEIKDGVALSELIARSPAAHACYARHWLEYLYGRPATRRDEARLTAIGAASAQGTLSVKGLIMELVQAPEFFSIDERDL